jgi:membrane protease YdiL (CAAX protease family)
MAGSSVREAPEARQQLWWFFALACAITWALNAPWVLACLAGEQPPAYVLPLMGLGAFGPTLAALLVAAPRGQASAIFRPWKTRPWLVIAGLLLSPLVLHLPANLLEVALGGRPAQWFHPPVASERILGLVFFSLGEEFGWRGFAYPRVVALHGPVRGNLLLGAVWAVWHLGMMFTPEAGAPALSELLTMLLRLSLSSVVWAWLLERGNRSLAIALALHASAHLDRVPDDEGRLTILRFLVLAVVAALAAWSLRSRLRGRAAQAAAGLPQ